LKVPKETQSSTKNIMKVAAEKAKVIKEVKKIDPKEENITREKRSTAGKFKSEKFSDTDLSSIKFKPKR
jgi:hypothetical protein